MYAYKKITIYKIHKISKALKQFVVIVNGLNVYKQKYIYF